MTVSTPNRLVIYQGNASAVVFPFDFDIPTNDDLSVSLQDVATGLITTIIPPGAYSVIGIGNPTGGSVTYPLTGSPLPATQNIVIIRTVPYLQQLDIENQGGFFPDTLEEQLDLIVMQIQQVAEAQSRSLIVPPGQVPPDLGVIEAAEGYAEDAAASALEASQYATFVRNNWVIMGPFTGTGVVDDLYPLSLDPVTVNNMFVIFGSTIQMLTQGAYDLVYVGGLPKLKATIPVGVLAEVHTSNAISIITPADGSVSTVKLGNQAVTYQKMQNITNALRILGGISAGSPVEITPAQLRDSFFPAGSVVDSVSAFYTTNADITSVIPADNTIPQNTEGTQILSVAITPKTTTNKLRIRFRGQGSANGVAAICAAIFDGGVGALNATVEVIDVANYARSVILEWEYVPAVVTAKTISIRVGPSGAGTIRMNGTTSAAYFGGVSACSLIVEEIKA